MKDFPCLLNVPLQELTSVKNVGNLKCVYFPKSLTQLKALVCQLNSESVPFIVIGKGSNLLINPKTSTAFVSLSAMPKHISVSNKELVVSANYSLFETYKFCLKHSLSGFEKLATIPGCIGGAIATNAGCFGRQIFDNLTELKILKNGKIKHIMANDILHEYHFANFDGIIIEAKFNLEKSSRQRLSSAFNECLYKRLSSQPKGLCFGSTFKNPPGQFAGQLIDKAGLKGLGCGDAIISSLHANFIINQGQATFDDIKKLIELCQSEVFSKFSIALTTEVKIIE